MAVAAGELDARVIVRGTDELADLTATFNEMSASLVEQRRRLVRSERLAILGQLSAGVAHEINNPLGVILGYVKLLQRGGGEPAETRKQLGIVEDEVSQCQRIVQGLLDLAHPVSHERSLVNLAELARDAVGRLVETGKTRGIPVEVAPAEGRAMVLGDPTALRQVVSNLVLNAVEASPPNGSVSVHVRAGDHAEIGIRDDGPGIPEDLLPRIFDPFFTTKPKGTGLGLAISQAIASAHDGTLELSPVPGGGTRAVLRLPLSGARNDKEAV
jgi:signal transduction histidine kinase